jgi:hypothetical protein
VEDLVRVIGQKIELEDIHIEKEEICSQMMRWYMQKILKIPHTFKISTAKNQNQG